MYGEWCEVTYQGDMNDILKIDVIDMDEKKKTFILFRMWKSEDDEDDDNNLEPGIYRQLPCEEDVIGFSTKEDVIRRRVYKPNSEENSKITYQSEEHTVKDLFIQKVGTDDGVYFDLFGIIIDLPSFYVHDDRWPYNSSTTAIDLFGNLFDENCVNHYVF